MVNPKSVLLVGLLAAGFAYQPTSTTAPSRAAAPAQTQVTSGRTITYDKDLEVRNWPLETIYQSFVDKAQARKAAKDLDCSAAAACGVSFIIATVPDPQNSQYPFVFDQFMQSIQRALGVDQYTLDQFWLPWDTEPVPPDSDFILREQHKDWLAKLQTNPGVLVFRNGEARMCVLLVGEDAVTGINKVEFSKATEIVRYFASFQHTKSTPKINILGPAFSGSIASLIDAINGLPKDHGETYSWDYITGSATSAPAIQQLSAAMGAPSGTEHQTIGSDDRALNAFLQYAKLKTSKDHVAILREAGTIYSQLVARSTEEWNQRDHSGATIQTFEYPLQISRLRNAYGNDPELGAILQTKSADAVRQGLEIPLKDEHASLDHLPSFSTEITPVSQEAAVLNTLATIDRLHIEYLGIVASDIMDSVFLGRLVKQHCPNTRLFILNADLIYGHSSQNNAFDGMLMATNYPLFYQRGKAGIQPQFSSAIEEGEYWATLELISRLDPGPQYKESSFVDSPWLAVVGRDGIWPIVAPLHKSSELTPLRASLGWHISFTLVSAFCILFAGAILCCNWNIKSEHLPLGWLSALRICERDNLSTRIALTLACALLLAFYALASWLQFSLRPSVGFVLCLPTLTILLAGAVCCWIPIKPWQICMAAAVSFGLCYVMSRHLPGSNAFLDRTLNVGNGVSPVVPSAILTAALLWLAWTHLSRIRLMHLFPLRFPPLTDDIFLTGTRKLHEDLRCILGHWTTGSYWPVFILGGVLFLSVVLLNPANIFSLETFHFEWLYAAGLYTLYFGLLIECTRFLRGWFTLENMLQMLERHALCQAFRRLPNELSPALLWRWGGGGHPFLVLAHFWNRLKQLSDQSERTTYPKHDPAYDEHVKLLGDCAQKLMSSPSATYLVTAKTLRDLDETVCIVFAALMQTMSHVWGSAAPKKRAIAAVALGASYEGVSGASKSPASDNYSLAEEIIALRFVELIAQVNLQLKITLEFIAGALILAVISINSYPFQPHHSITSMLTIYFFAMSAVFIMVFLQMNRNTIISYLSDTTPGKLDGNIFHVLSFGGLPLLAVISSQFPSIGGFLFAWVKPALETLR